MRLLIALLLTVLLTGCGGTNESQPDISPAIVLERRDALKAHSSQPAIDGFGMYDELEHANLTVVWDHATSQLQPRIDVEELAAPLSGIHLGHGVLSWAGTDLFRAQTYDPQRRFLAGDVELSLESDTMNGTLAITNIQFWRHMTPDEARQTYPMPVDEHGDSVEVELHVDPLYLYYDWRIHTVKYGQWEDGELNYRIGTNGNSFFKLDGDEGAVEGVFLGPAHEEMAGTLRREDLVGVFGGRR